MLSRVEERAIHLLASGLQQVQVASILGITPALISQWKVKEEFTTSLEAATIEANKGDKEEVALTAKYHAAENALVDQVMALAPIAELRDVVAALRVVGERQDKAKTRLNPMAANPSTINQTVINLTLPSHSLPEFSVNNDNQIVAIDSKSIAPLSAGGVADLFKQFSLNKLENQNDPSRIPSSAESSTPKAPEALKVA